MNPVPKTAAEFRTYKGNRRIAMVTAYDAAASRMLEAAGIDMVLVGDSAANAVLGLASTQDIGMDEMLVFVGAVRRGSPSLHVVADMPWGSDDDPQAAVRNAKRFRQAGADSVKVEGYKPEAIRAIVSEGIEVVGHLGLLPQTATSRKQVGKDPEEAATILRQAKELEDAGVFALVVEHVPDELGSRIQAGVGIPVIGIGAGADVDGQVLVFHDLLGMHPFRLPPFAEKFFDAWSQCVGALVCYRTLVHSGGAPGRRS